jgi:hypothetical protein
MLKVSIDPAGLTRMTLAMERLRKAATAGIVDPKLGTLPVQSRLLAERCLAMTPPRNKKQGEAAVARDITSVVRGREPGYLEAVERIAGTSSVVRQHLTTKDGRTYLIDVDQIDRDGSMIRRWHQKQRRARGRVPRGTSKNNDTIIGRWQARDTLWAPAEMVRAYIAKRQQGVGLARAGWVKPILALGGVRVPDWVKRQGMRYSGYVDGLRQKRPFIQANNNTRWGQYRAQAEKVVRDAIRARVRDMERFYLLAMKRAAGEATSRMGHGRPGG